MKIREIFSWMMLLSLATFVQRYFEYYYKCVRVLELGSTLIMQSAEFVKSDVIFDD